MNWIDVTVPIHPGMPVWPGETAPRVWRSKEIGRHGVNVTELVLGAHTGTHVDAPCHFIPDGAGVEALPLSVLVGTCHVVTMDVPAEVTEFRLESRGLPSDCVRVLLRTRNRHRSLREGSFAEDFVALSRDAARWIVDHGIRLVGVDYLSVQPYHHRRPDVHVTLLDAGVVIVEGLDLSGVGDGAYDLICLPLLVPGSDGAPARVLLRQRVDA